jgi:hypothetical protein
LVHWNSDCNVVYKDSHAAETRGEAFAQSMLLAKSGGITQADNEEYGVLEQMHIL